MELTFARCESIVNTLPVGYYAGRRISVVVDKEEETSFYTPMEDKIVVSYPIIAHRMAQITTTTCDEEEAVRSMLYHEVAHAILTPAKDLNITFQVNVFEDERIESVLRNFFYGVNFRKQIYEIHGGHAPKTTDANGAFFNAVRFGLGTGKVQTEINRMLKKYASINRTTDRFYSNPCAYEYEEDINNLYNLIRREWKSNPDAFNEPKSGKQGEGQMKDMDSVSSKEKSGATRTAEDKKGEKGKNDDFSEDTFGRGDPHHLAIDEENIKKMVSEGLKKNAGLNEEQTNKLADFQKCAEMIISNFNKKNSGGCGINAYSGVFNPRAVARKDYRYFERAMTTQGNNKFGTCHLNLIIDCSGSFYHNVPLTNGILNVMSEIERKNRNFSMDVAFINEDFRICKSVRERTMSAHGGNRVPDNMKEILMSLQKPQTCNYNIVLFDGDAVCDNDYRADRCKLFSAFDMKQTTLITDIANKPYMNPSFTSTKVIITKDYTKELIDHILRALTIAFG